MLTPEGAFWVDRRMLEELRRRDVCATPAGTHIEMRGCRTRLISAGPRQIGMTASSAQEPVFHESASFGTEVCLHLLRS